MTPKKKENELFSTGTARRIPAAHYSDTLEAANLIFCIYFRLKIIYRIRPFSFVQGAILDG
jgi:hypothetical protein